MTDITAFTIGNFTSVFSTSLLSVAVEDVQHTAAVRGLDIVLIRGPDQPVVLLPGHVHSLTTSEGNSKCKWVTKSECGVFKLPDKASRFCEKQGWLLDSKQAGITNMV